MGKVIWGLDLGEIKWSKFKSSYMWNTEYHLRRTKLIVYQCAMIFCVISESLGTAVLSGGLTSALFALKTLLTPRCCADYTSGQRHIQGITNQKYYVSNNDYVGAASYNIFAGVFVAFIFGAAFFFDLIWPERHESTSVRIAWKACGVLAVIFHFAAALTITIITATRTSYITGMTPSEQQELWSQYGKYKEAPLDYKHNSRAIAAVVFAWPGFIAVVGR